MLVTTIFTTGSEAATGMFIGMISTLAFFTTIIIFLVLYYRTRYKERMALIEKGVDVSEIYKKRNTGSALLKYGLFLIGLAIGLFFGFIFSTYTSMDPVVAYFVMILLFGGASLVVSFFINKKQVDG